MSESKVQLPSVQRCVATLQATATMRNIRMDIDSWVAALEKLRRLMSLEDIDERIRYAGMLSELGAVRTIVDLWLLIWEDAEFVQWIHGKSVFIHAFGAVQLSRSSEVLAKGMRVGGNSTLSAEKLIPARLLAG